MQRIEYDSGDRDRLPRCEVSEENGEIRARETLSNNSTTAHLKQKDISVTLPCQNEQATLCAEKQPD